MDDSVCYQYFEKPDHTFHRRYEAIRAVFVDGRRHEDVVKDFGHSYSTTRQMVYKFRQVIHNRAECLFSKIRTW